MIAAHAARVLAADVAVELAVKEGDGASGKRQRMRNAAEQRRHVAEQRVDREAGGEQQQRVGDDREHERAALSAARRAKGQSMTRTGVMLCGHGSRDPEAIGEFELLAKALRRAAAGGGFRHRLSRIRAADDPRWSRRASRARGAGESSRRPGCCSPQAMSRTICRGRSTVSPPIIRGSRCALAATSASSRNC